MYTASRTFGISYQALRDKMSGRTSIKIQYCGYESVFGEHIENKLVVRRMVINVRRFFFFFKFKNGGLKFGEEFYGESESDKKN